MSILKDSTLGIAKRLGLVLGLVIAIPLSIHIAARLIWTHWSIFKSSDSAVSGWPWDDTVKTTKSFWNYAPVDGFDIFLSHGLGLIAVVVAALALGAIVGIGDYVINGPSDHVDPCQDPNCTCARHKVERQEEAESAALAVGVAGGIVGGIIGGSITK